ncbi:MAG: CoB--CoM heterodisulfide reductase iron-sulfur subunit A family protein, partial [Acidobacteria bacterium]|nr:CoB--CoM heterodisulfide reductase iron-sulfur subunit A family protein [Acidobacteriota bacterium]
MARKLGVYVCSGCAIGEAVDTDRLLRSARSDFKIAASLVHPFLCGSEAGQAICKDIAEGAVDAAVIGACSPRVKTDIFSFDAVAVERVNLREHVAWSHVPRQDQTQSLAEDYLKMGLARAQRIEPLDACSEPASTTVLVVGGGMTGLTAALEAADVGHDVVLIEKQAALGGFMASVDRRFPVSPPYHELAINRTSELVATVSYHPRIRTLTSATILQTSGQPGSFDVTVQTEAGVSILRIGAIVLATGWKPYDATTLVHLGYGLSPNVVTNVEFERMAARGPIARPSDGRALETVLFVQCAGSRNAAHLSYCSSVC